ARTACDRLVVATGSGEGEAEALASSPLVDLVCALPGETAPDMVALLRPDLVIDASPPPDAAELVRSWGG
ncbi:hypothetical protein ACSTKE_00030, partial [Vibrio parahaemolyticus]